jgi:hypothetical protein
MLMTRQKNMAMGPAGPETNNDYAGAGQQQFTGQIEHCGGVVTTPVLYCGDTRFDSRSGS